MIKKFATYLGFDVYLYQANNKKGLFFKICCYSVGW